MGSVDVVCPFYWFHIYQQKFTGIVHPKIIIIIILSLLMLLQTCTMFFFETQKVFFEKYSGPLFQYNQRE